MRHSEKRRLVIVPESAAYAGICRRRPVEVSIYARDGASGPGQPRRDRLKKLAKSLETLARKDESFIRRAEEIGSLRRHAAMELHGICGEFRPPV